jgi:hypothetical protein
MIEKKMTAAQADNIQVKQLYESAFPKNERIPWTDLVRLGHHHQRTPPTLDLGLITPI